MKMTEQYDLVVIGCGAAGLAAAVTFAEKTAGLTKPVRLALLERSTKETRGGATRWTGVRSARAGRDGHRAAGREAQRDDFLVWLRGRTSTVVAKGNQGRERRASQADKSARIRNTAVCA